MGYSSIQNEDNNFGLTCATPLAFHLPLEETPISSSLVSSEDDPARTDRTVVDATQVSSASNSAATVKPTTANTAICIGSPPKVTNNGETGISLSHENPVTDELFNALGGSGEGKISAEKVGGTTTSTAKSASSRRPQQKYKPTALTFRELNGEATVAKCVLVLCNISEVPLQFRLKSSPGSNIVSIPFGNGHIAPHSQLRLTLTWTRSPKYKTWKEVPPPKMVLSTRFLDVPKAEDNDVTHTRLVAKMGSKKCNAENPPVEQLLLDAAGKQEEKLDLPVNLQGENGLGQALADFVNNLSDRGLCVLIVILALFVLLFTGSRH